jgi:hypothetical protein
MIPVIQKYFHIPNKQKGDCYRAAIASVIECEIEDLPRPLIKESWSKYCFKLDEKLKTMGWMTTQYGIRTIKEGMLSSPDTDGYVLALGKSPRFNGTDRINHFIVWRNGLAHDPHPDNLGILDIIDFEILTKINS